MKQETKGLFVVGQEVLMKSGIYGQKGTVTRITEQGFEVELLQAEGPLGLRYGIRFDTNGRACDSRDIYEGNIWGNPNSGIPGTHEFGPWELV
jgi:hypothetical protein